MQSQSDVTIMERLLVKREFNRCNWYFESELISKFICSLREWEEEQIGNSQAHHIQHGKWNCTELLNWKKGKLLQQQNSHISEQCKCECKCVAVAALDTSQITVMTAIYQRITGAFASVLPYLFILFVLTLHTLHT